MWRDLRSFSALHYLRNVLRNAKNIVVCGARSCVHPYGCLLGLVSVIAIFQIINVIDPPFVIKSKDGVVGDVDQDPIGLPIVCEWNVHIFARVHGLRKRAEYTSLMSRMEKQAGQFAAKVACVGKENQIPCTLRVTMSANETDLRNKDAVIFGMSTVDIKGSADKFAMKHPAEPGQLWVFYNMQSPLEVEKAAPDVGRFPLHLMWSYLTSSVITTPYALHLQTGVPMDKGNGTYGQYVSGKRKLVAWMGNNCPGSSYWPSGRYLEELREYIPVDMYGECTNLTCLPRISEQCGMLIGRYKFFLAFESSECQEFITDQFWYTALQHQSVPVVYGPKKDSYLKVAPPFSFIHVSDFESPKALADYLVMIDKNDGLYLRFFKWRQTGRIYTSFHQFKPESLCKLLPHIEDMKAGRFERKTLAQTKWFQSCRGSGNVTVTNSDKNWLPWS